MTDLFTHFNIEALGLKPFHYNWVKIALLAMCLGALVWVLAARSSVSVILSVMNRFSQLRKSGHRWLVWGLGFSFSLVLAYLKVRQHFELQTSWDLATESNIAWHMVHGPWFFNSLDNRIALSQHFALVFLFIGLVYPVWESPVTLLIIQSAGLGLGAVAVYYLALQLGARPFWAPVAVLLYSSNWFLHVNNVRDFHRPVLAIPIGLWMLYCVEKGRKVLAAGLAALLLTLQEDMGLTLVGLGLYLLAFRPSWRVWGASAAVIGFGYFLLVFKVLMPALSPEKEPFLWGLYAHLGPTFEGAVLNLLLHPIWAIEQILFRHKQFIRVLYLLASLGFLPLLAWRQALLAVIPLSFMLLSERSGLYSLGHHYTSPALPFLLYSALYGIVRVDAWLQQAQPLSGWRWKAIAVCLLVCLGWNVYRVPDYDVGKTNPEYASAAFELAGLIPPDASVAVDMAFTPLLSNRHRVCKLRFDPNDLCDWTLEGAPPSYYQGRRFQGPGWQPEYVMLREKATTDQQDEACRREALVAVLSAQDSAYELLGKRAGIAVLKLKTLRDLSS